MSACMGPGCTHPDHGHVRLAPNVWFTPLAARRPRPFLAPVVAQVLRERPKPTRQERRAAAKARRSR